MFVLPPTGNGTYHKLSISGPRSVHNSMYVLPRAKSLCSFSVLERVRIIEVFVEEMYEDFDGI